MHAENETTENQKPKAVKRILDEQIEMGLHEYNRSNLGLFISSLAAGLEIGFGVLLMATVHSIYGAGLSAQELHFYLTLCYPVGFIFVIIGRSELFTEHTTLAILPVLNRSRKVKNLLVLWGFVYTGNLLGGYLFSALIYVIAPNIGLETETFYHLAHKLVDHTWDSIFLSAILAGWLMGLLGWLVTSSQDTISRIFLIILVTFLIGLIGLHHCVIGSVEVFLGYIMCDKLSLSDYVHFQFWATIGNAVGGVFFVAVLKFGHARAD